MKESNKKYLVDGLWILAVSLLVGLVLFLGFWIAGTRSYDEPKVLTRQHTEYQFIGDIDGCKQYIMSNRQALDRARFMLTICDMGGVTIIRL